MTSEIKINNWSRVNEMGGNFEGWKSARFRLVALPAMTLPVPSKKALS